MIWNSMILITEPEDCNKVDNQQQHDRIDIYYLHKSAATVFKTEQRSLSLNRTRTHHLHQPPHHRYGSINQ